MCGARSVCAIDVNLDAVRSARKNTARNACDDRVAVIHGRLPLSGRAPVDLLVANLVADTHLRNLDHFVAAVRRGGCLVLGGIEATRIADVRAAVADRGLRIDVTRRRDGWGCLKLRAPANPEASA